MSSLFEKLGGQDELVTLVYGVYDMMKQDPELSKFFARHNLTRLKDRTVDYLGGEWGGAKYRGSNLFMSHSHLGVTQHHYDVMMRCYIAMFKKMKTDKNLVKELLASLESMRDPTVDPSGKHRKAYMKDIKGDPFNEETWRKAAADRVRKENEFKEKMAAARKLRLEREKLENEEAARKLKERAKKKDQTENQETQSKEQSKLKEHHKDQKEQKEQEHQKNQSREHHQHHQHQQHQQHHQHHEHHQHHQHHQQHQQDTKDAQSEQKKQNQQQNQQQDQPVKTTPQVKHPSKRSSKHFASEVSGHFCFQPIIDLPPEQIRQSSATCGLGISFARHDTHISTAQLA